MPKGGLARRATAIARLRQQAAGPVLVLDSGNSLFALKATPTSDPSRGALPVAAMNAMQYDALALGEYELATDLATLQQRFQEATFALLSANVTPAGALPKVQPYILRSLEGHSVAIIGLTNPAAAKRAQALGLNLTIEDAAAALQRTLAEIGGQAEVVIVLSNLDLPTNEALARQVPGIDAIIGVNGGQQMDPKAVVGVEGQVVLHASYIQGEYLGFLTLGFDSAGHVAQFSGRALPLDPGYADDPDVAAMMRSYGVKP
ncbi:MAG: hypothetical protein ACP5OO_05285 [Chloroflexia bacterium]